MQTHSTILAAAKLIREIDPALAQAFIAKPFHRHALVTTFHKSLCDSQYVHLADHIAVRLRSAIDMSERDMESTE